MPLFLHIETATPVCSVCLSDGNRFLSIREKKGNNVHSSQLTLLIKQLFEDCGSSLNSLDAIAVSKGPGSYTGLRIGVSTAKGICYSLDKPLISVETLASMAFGMSQQLDVSGDPLLCPVIDARRMEVYTAFFDFSLNKVRDTQAFIFNEENVSVFRDGNKYILFGTGAEKLIPIFETDENVLLVRDFEQSSSYMLPFIQNAWDENRFEEVRTFEPYYLKDFAVTTPKNKLSL